MALQENIQEENIKEDDKVVPEVLPEKRPPEVETAAKVEKKLEEGVVPSGAIKPEIIGKEPVKKAIVKDIVKQQEQKAIPSINDFVSGKTFMLGDNEVDPDLIAKVQTGDQDSLVELGGLIDEYALATKAGPPIPSVRFEPTGKGKVVKIVEDEEVQKELTKYGQARLDLYNRMKGIGLRDENALNALVKYYSTGDFLQEGGRRVTQAGSFIAQIPFGLNILRHLNGALFDSVSSMWDDNESRNPIEQFKKRLPQISKEFNSYRSFIEDDLGLKGLTYGSLIDSRVKEKIKEDLIKKHGKEEGEARYNAQYTVQDPVSGKRSEIRLISDDMGSELLDIGFKELPVSEKFLLFGAENLTIASGLGKAAVKKGTKQIERATKARQDNPLYKDWDDVQIIRHLEIQDKKNVFSRTLRRITASLGTRFKSRGAIGSAEFNQNHATRIQSIDKQIDRLEARRIDATPDIKKQIDGEIENLQTQRSRALFGSGKILFNMNNKFLFQTQKDELLITFAQTVGHQNADFFGLSSGTGEMIGAFGMAFRLPQVLLTSAPVRGFGNLVNAITFGLPRAGYGVAKDAVGFSGKVLENLPIIPRGFFLDRRLENIESQIGRKLTASEKESVAYMQKAIFDLDPEDREKIFDNIREYQDLRVRIIKQFDGNPELQKEAEKAFNLSFAHISGLAPIIALRNRALGKINGRNPDFTEAAAFQIEAENGRMAASVAFKRLEELLNQQGAGIQDNKFLREFVDNFKTADSQLKDQFNQDRIAYQQLLDKYIRSFGDYESEMDAGELDKLVDLEIALNKGDVNNLTLRREKLNELSTKVYEGLTERLKTVKKLRGTPIYRRKLGRIVEEVYDTQISKQYAEGRIGYIKAEKYAADNNKQLDISSLVQNMVSKGEGLKAKELKKFFSAEGKFFYGRSGRLARNAFNDMAKRSLQDTLDLNDEQITELFIFHRNQGSAATGDYLGDKADYVDIVLHLANKSDKKYQPFTATPFELDEVRRHFKRVAEGTKDEKVAKLTDDFANAAEDELRKDPIMYSMIEEARSTYQDRVFDPRRKGSVGDKIDNARVGPPFVTKSEDGYAFPYAPGNTPDRFHSDIGDSLKDIIDNKPRALDDLGNKIKDIERFWGDNVKGQIAFDLTTEDGQKKYDLVSRLIEANVYEHWGALKETTLENIKLRSEAFGKLPSAKYNFANKDNLEKVSDGLRVKVWNGTNFESRTLFDPTEMFAVEQDISKLIQLDNTVAREHNKLINEVNGTVGELRERANFKIKEQEKFNQEVFDITRLKNTDQFFEQYIANGTVGSVEGIKQQYIAARTSKDTANRVTEAVAEKEFDTGIKSVIAKGLLKRAKITRSERVSFQDVTTGTEKNATIMRDTQQFSNDMFDENISGIMEEYLDKEHVDFLKDLSLFFEYSQGTSLAKKYLPEGMVRGVSPNELISRAFNLARGMVSPTYVVAELGVRVSMNHDIEVLELAITNKQVARALNDILITNNPTDDDVKNLAVLLKTHIANGLAQSNVLASEYSPQDPLENAKYQKMIGGDRKKQTLEKIEEEDKADENV
tara:strand:+ start:3308 stop:7981 length:4674 start_codon:yes stop_codon:yes gene_type:complete